MIRIVLAAGTARDDTDDAAAALGLLLVNIVPRTDTFPAQWVYLSPDRAAVVHLVDDGGALTWVVRAEGEGSAALERRWADAISAELTRPEAAS